jgi:hypothetical protein
VDQAHPLRRAPALADCANLSRDVSFRLPIAVMDTTSRKLRLAVFLAAGDLVLDVRYLPVEVNLPKN